MARALHRYPEADLLGFCSKSQQLQREISGLAIQCNNVASWMCRLGYRLIPVVNVVFMSASCVCAPSIVGFAHSRQCGNALGAINASIYMAFLLVSVIAWIQRAISISFSCAANSPRIPAPRISFRLRNSGSHLLPNARAKKYMPRSFQASLPHDHHDN